MANDGSAGSPVHNIKKPPSKKEDWLNLVDECYRYASKGRSNFDYIIKENSHFLVGDQWIRHDHTLERFESHGLEDWIPTPVTNLLIEYYDYLVDLFTSGNSQPDVRPATRDQADIESAKAAHRSLRSEFERLNTEGLLLPEAAGWLALTGNAILYSGWNSHRGDLVRMPKMKSSTVSQMYNQVFCPSCNWTEREEAYKKERCPECNSPLQSRKSEEIDIFGQVLKENKTEQVSKDGIPQYDEFKVGNVEERCINILNWFPMPARQWEDVQQHGWVVETDPVDVDRVKDLFGSKAKDVVAEAISSSSWGVLPAKQHNDGIFDSGQRKEESDKVLLKIFRHAPNHKFKNGALTISSEGHLFYKGDLDSCDGKLPYTMIKYRSVPGMFWGEGPVTDLIPNQKRLNAIDSTVVLNRKQNVSPQWLIPEGAGITKVTGRSGAVYRWSPHASGGFQPQRMPGMQLPSQVMEERAQTISAMNQQVGLPEIMRGNLPQGASGLETGAAVEFLFERAYKRFGQSIRNWRIGLSEHYHRNLKNMAKYWDEDRLVKIVGDNKDLQSYYYNKANFYSAEDMLISASLGAEDSQVGRTQKIMQAVNMGLVGDIRDPAIRGKVLEEMKIEGFDVEYLLDAKKARRVLQSIRDGEDPEPFLPQVDNHPIQYQVFKEYMLTYEFSQERPEIQQAILQRGSQHQQVMQQQQQQAMAQAQAVKGTGENVSQQLIDNGGMGGQPPTQKTGVA